MTKKFLIAKFDCNLISADFKIMTHELKSDNFQYNTVRQWNDSMIVPPSDGLIFILIDWESFSETVGC